jgi:hypothetical protein
MLKVSTFLNRNELGYTAIPLFGSKKTDREFEKTAGAGLLPAVSNYISSLRRRQGSQYVLVNALGAGEYYGSNINGDHFPEEGLIHCPPGWTDNPIVDRPLSANWPYGFPSFYSAHPFAHHKNKDPSRAYGEVELAIWNDQMKRVELVVRVDYDKCLEFGGTPVWDKLTAGMFPDVSMGSRVPFDTSSITLDWDKYNKAKATYDSKRHASPGQAILEYHKKDPITGLSITRDDYDEYCLKYMNRILPDGRKVFVYNDYPRFFDISFVFIGADRTAKVLVHISKNEPVGPEKTASVQVAVSTAPWWEGIQKTASISDDILKTAFLGKDAKDKSAEIDKEVSSIPDAAKAIPLMTKNEPDLSSDMLHALSSVPLSNALSTTSGLGMVLRPREFQRIILIRGGQAPLADALEDKNITFPQVEESTPCDMGFTSFLPALARMLMPLFQERTALAPAIERRVTIISSDSGDVDPKGSTHSSELLRKIGAAYNGYREQLLDMAPYSQVLIQKVATSKDFDLQKVASASPSEVFTSLSYCYLRDAFKNEVCGCIV